jgi:hypothetical protein
MIGTIVPRRAPLPPPLDEARCFDVARIARLLRGEA